MRDLEQITPVFLEDPGKGLLAAGLQLPDESLIFEHQSHKSSSEWPFAY
jgi:hypothetical protein